MSGTKKNSATGFVDDIFGDEPESVDNVTGLTTSSFAPAVKATMLVEEAIRQGMTSSQLIDSMLDPMLIEILCHMQSVMRNAEHKMEAIAAGNTVLSVAKYRSAQIKQETKQSPPRTKITFVGDEFETHKNNLSDLDDDEEEDY